MLFSRMSSLPNTTVGLSMAYDSPDSRRDFSTVALPLKYGSGESKRGVGYADVDDAPDARRLRRREQRAQIPRRALVRHVAARYAYPVRVEERVRALEASRQRVRVVERERDGLDWAVERVGTVGMPGERANFVPALQQQARDVLAGVAGGSGYGVGFGHYDRFQRGRRAASARRRSGSQPRACGFM